MKHIRRGYEKKVTNRSSVKVVILCGGKGTRLSEETEFRPKPLVKIGDMPILWHIMKIYSHYGFHNFILCLGYKSEMIKDFFLNYEEMVSNFTLNLRSRKNNKRIFHHTKENLENWKITFVDTGKEAQTGTRIYKIKEYLKNDENFLLTYGDGVADINVNELMDYHLQKSKVLTVSGVYSRSVFGLIEHNNGLVKTFREKPKLEDVISGGFFACNKKIFDYLSDSNLCVFEDKPMKTLAKKGEIALYRHYGFWYCMDTQKHVDELNMLWGTGKAYWKIWDKNK